MEAKRDMVVLLSAAEWNYIERMRGANKTGFACHTYNGITYYWSWGQQPSEEIIALIGDESPTVAAEKFLAVFNPAAPNAHGYTDTYKAPTRKEAP